MSMDVVIVCYHAAQLTIDCLHSIKEDIAQLPDSKVIVCENGTEGNSADIIQAAIDEQDWNDWVELRTISPNRGFSGGNNVILQEIVSREVKPKYTLLLNADTYIRPGALVSLYNAAEQFPDAGIIGPRIEWPDGEPQTSCFRYISPISELVRAADTGPVSKLLKSWVVPMPVSDTPIEPDWASFACALIRTELLESIGLLDEGYFLYFDDVDYCRVARNNGWTVKYWPDARIVHLQGQSNPVEELTRKRKRRPRYYYASRSWYLAKFYGRTGLYMTNVLWYFGRSISLLRELLGRKHVAACEKEWVDIWTNGLNPLKE